MKVRGQYILISNYGDTMLELVRGRKGVMYYILFAWFWFFSFRTFCNSIDNSL
jgi:hypothetical protein